MLTHGRFDYHYSEYVKINGDKPETVAHKDWYYTHQSDTEFSTRYEYSVMGKPVEKSEYKDYVKSIKQSNVIDEEELEWNKVAIREESLD